MTGDTIDLAVDTRELETALAKLAVKAQRNVMRNALQAAGDVLLGAVVAHTPERTDEESPNSAALPPGVLKADMHTQIQIGRVGRPRVKVGPSIVTGYVAYRQNNGYTLTSHGSKKGRHPIARKNGKPNPIPGKHFMEAAFDESAQTAVDMFLATLADGLFGTGAELEGVGAENTSLDVEF